MAEQSERKKNIFSRITGSRTNIILGVIALLIIFGSLSALIYNAMNTRSTDTLTVNGKDYDWNTLESDFDIIEFDGQEGISLEEIFEDSGITDPESSSFRFIGSDGYEKEVPWGDLTNGIINIEEKKVIFPELAKAFWVRDLVEIEVV